MHSGRLSERITIQRYNETADAQGSLTKTWSTYAARWAEIIPGSVNENFKLDQNIEERTGTMILRFDKVTEAITAKDQVVYKNRTFKIEGVENLNKQIKLYYREYGS